VVPRARLQASLVHRLAEHASVDLHFCFCQPGREETLAEARALFLNNSFWKAFWKFRSIASRNIKKVDAEGVFLARCAELGSQSTTCLDLSFSITNSICISNDSSYLTSFSFCSPRVNFHPIHLFYISVIVTHIFAYF
jgi:hypothetical protein